MLKKLILGYSSPARPAAPASITGPVVHIMSNYLFPFPEDKIDIKIILVGKSIIHKYSTNHSVEYKNEGELYNDFVLVAGLAALFWARMPELNQNILHTAYWVTHETSGFGGPKGTYVATFFQIVKEKRVLQHPKDNDIPLLLKLNAPKDKKLAKQIDITATAYSIIRKQ